MDVKRKRRRTEEELVYSKVKLALRIDNVLIVLVIPQKLKRRSIQGRKSVTVKEKVSLVEDGQLALDHSKSDEEVVQIEDGMSGGVDVCGSGESDGDVGEEEGVGDEFEVMKDGECEAVSDGRRVRLKPSGHQSLFKPPTHEELQTLKETQNLFKSNLMKLQVSHTYCMPVGCFCVVQCAGYNFH